MKHNVYEMPGPWHYCRCGCAEFHYLADADVVCGHPTCDLEEEGKLWPFGRKHAECLLVLSEEDESNSRRALAALQPIVVAEMTSAINDYETGLIESSSPLVVEGDVAVDGES